MEATIAPTPKPYLETPVALAQPTALPFILGRPQTRRVQALWSHFCLSHAWGEVSQMYDLEAAE